MPADDRMTIDERRKYLKRMAQRYWKADPPEAGALLTEMEAVVGLHRQSLLRLLHAPSLDRPPPRPRVRRRRYGPAVEDVLRVVWESLDYVCAERLTPLLVPTAQHLAGYGELQLSVTVVVQLGAVSRATVQRRLRRFRQDTPRLPRRGPERANRLTRTVPVGRLPWQTAAPGHLRRLVHHCGPVAAGEYVHTLQLVEVATGWSERVAVIGRSQQALVQGCTRQRTHGSSGGRSTRRWNGCGRYRGSGAGPGGHGRG